ncbi:MAG: cell wall protein [Actinomycetaceae bacterium]|nr:cell wall protein [Actinomycetaceae bacterium]
MTLSKGARAKRWGSVAITGLAITALATPLAFGADSYPPQGDASVKASQPVVSGYRVQNIRDWSPESDPYAEQLRATVPLQERNEANPQTQVKPELDGKAEIMLMQGDYGNSFFGSTTHNNTFGELAFNFWQYADYWSPWHGAASVGVPQAIYDPQNSDWRNRGFEFGVMTLPTREYTNAAHRNGVKSIAVLYFDPYFRPGLTYKELFEKDADGNYVVADKLVEMANYYGFDGYFLNEEEGGPAREEFKPFMAYLTSKGLYTQWYDTNSYMDARKAQWLSDEQYGKIHDSVFVNYGNNGSQMHEWSVQNGYDPYAQVFAGIEANQTGFAGDGGVSRGFASAENHSPLTSIALFTPSDHYQRELDGKIEGLTGRVDKTKPFMQQQPYQWMIADRERMYFSGAYSDVTKTGPENTQTRPEIAVDEEGWIGVADFVPARSVIDGTEFATDFSTGKGMRSYTNGGITNDSEWIDLGAQSILPSWQWWISTESGDTTLEADFDYGPEPRVDIYGNEISTPFEPVGAYNGGNSLVLHGDISEPHDLRLFKTDLAIAEDSKAKVTLRAAANGNLSLKLGLVFKDDAEQTVAVDLPEVTSEWTTAEIDLSEFAGKQIATIGLIIDGQATGAQVNIGELSVGRASTNAPATPTGLNVRELNTDGSATVAWDIGEFEQVDYYVLEAIGNDGQVRHLGKTFGDVHYVKDVGLDGDYFLSVRAIGKSGLSSEPAMVFVGSSALPTDLEINEAMDENEHFAEAVNAGEVEVSWQSPASGADGYTVRMETLYADAVSPFHGYTQRHVGADTTSVTLPAPLEGMKFRVTVTPDGYDSSAVAAKSVVGRYHDAYSAPLEMRDVSLLGGASFQLNNPTSNDWQQIVSAGDEEWTATRGKSNRSSWGQSDENGSLTKRRTVESQIEYVIRDYAGNVSQGLAVKNDDGEAQLVDSAAPQVWGTPWGVQDVAAGKEMVPVEITAVDNTSDVTVAVGFVEASQAVDEEGDSAEVMTDLADGITFDAQTLTISGTPTWEGERILRVIAMDESSNKETFDFTVRAHGVPEGSPDPEEPGTTETTDPEKPGTTETTDPEKPETSDDPTEPEEPVIPEEPTAPEESTQPSVSVDPGQSGMTDPSQLGDNQKPNKQGLAQTGVQVAALAVLGIGLGALGISAVTISRRKRM